MEIKEAKEILESRIALIKSEFPEMADYREALEIAVNALEKRTVKVTGERLTASDEKAGPAYYPQCFEEPCFGMGCEKKECLLKYAVVEKLAKYEDLEEKIGEELTKYFQLASAGTRDTFIADLNKIVEGIKKLEVEG